MSRIEENKEMFDQWSKLTFTGSPEKINIQIRIAQINVLMDISKSLAIIANSMTEDTDDGK